jgi:hypothetical protein
VWKILLSLLLAVVFAKTVSSKTFLGRDEIDFRISMVSDRRAINSEFGPLREPGLPDGKFSNQKSQFG